MSSLSLFLVNLVVHFYVLNRKTERKWLLISKVIILISDVNVFDLVLNTPKDPSDKAQQRWLIELLLLLDFLSRQLISITYRVPLLPDHLLSILLSYLLPFLSSQSFPFKLLLLFDFGLDLPLLLPCLIYNLMHHHYVLNLVIEVIKATFGVIRKVLIFRHEVFAGAEHQVHVT